MRPANAAGILAAMNIDKLHQLYTFILAGGQGERLYPLTQSRPKPAVSFGGLFRMIDFTLSNCLHSMLPEVSILTQYKHEALHRYIREAWSELWNASSRSESLLCLSPVSGKRYRGTADAVFQNLELVPAHSDYVLVLSGDHIYQMNYSDMVRQHIETNADVTIAAVECPIQDARRFGVLQIDTRSRVIRFEEKPMLPCAHAFSPDMALVSMGVYIFRKSILSGALNVVCGSGQGCDFGRHVIPALIHSVNTCAYTFRSEDQKVPGYWRDIGTIDAYYAASMDVIRDGARFDPYSDHAQRSRPTPHPKVTNLASMRARPSQIHPTATIVRSVLSPNVEIGEGAFVCDAVLLPGVQVGARARLCRAVVEEGVSIPTDFCAGLDIDQDRKLHTVSDSGVVVVASGPGSLSYQVSSMSQVAVR